MPSALMPLLAVVVMLTIIWSESLRKRPAPRPLLYVRAVLFIAATALLVMRLVEGGWSPGERAMLVVAIGVGITGIVFFARKAAAARKS